MTRIALIVFAKALLLIASTASASDTTKYVFLMIGDGMGAAQRQVTEYYLQEQKNEPNYQLAMNSMPTAGMITTHSADSLVTDSAAAGTALATGFKTNNGIISLTPSGERLISIVEAAEEKGWATGLVSTTRLTHATPAVFVANNLNRNNENEIALDLIDSGVDFFAGGGYRHFVKGEGSKRADGRDLVNELQVKGYKTFIGEDSTKSFLAHEPEATHKVLAAFTKSHMPYEIDRLNENINVPSLAEMTSKGIQLLSKDEDGFFMMVEGGRIDHAAHANDIASTIHDTIAFDDAVRVALDFYREFPNETLIVVVGDHETGGLGLGIGKQYFLTLGRIANVSASIADVLQGVFKERFFGYRPAFYNYLAETFSLTDLTEDERARIEQAMEFVNSGEKDVDNIWGGYGPVAMAVSHVISERSGVQWTSHAHTATSLPLSAIGRGSDQLGGFTDNTDVAKRLAKIMAIEIGKEKQTN